MSNLDFFEKYTYKNNVDSCQFTVYFSKAYKNDSIWHTHVIRNISKGGRLHSESDGLTVRGHETLLAGIRGKETLQFGGTQQLKMQNS